VRILGGSADDWGISWGINALDFGQLITQRSRALELLARNRVGQGSGQAEAYTLTRDFTLLGSAF